MLRPIWDKLLQCGKRKNTHPSAHQPIQLGMLSLCGQHCQTCKAVGQYVCEVVWRGNQPQPWCCIPKSGANLAGVMEWKCTHLPLRQHTNMAQTLCIWLIWMYEAIWGRYWPQTWRCGIISTPQVKLTSQILGQLGCCNGIRAHPYAFEKAYQHGLKTLFMSNMDVWSNLRWISDSNMTLDSIFSTPQVNLNPQIWGQLGRCNGIRVQPCALETAYQWLKQFVYV